MTENRLLQRVGQKTGVDVALKEQYKKFLDDGPDLCPDYNSSSLVVILNDSSVALGKSRGTPALSELLLITACESNYLKITNKNIHKRGKRSCKHTRTKFSEWP